MTRPLVVIADPHTETRALLAEIFREELNTHVTLVKDTSDLGSALFETVPALVLVQIGRDRLTDMAAIAEMRRLHPRIPFLILTAHDVDEDNVEDRTGADAVISKPFELVDVIETAQALMSRDAVRGN